MNGSPPQVAAGVREGDIIAGKYRVDRILGQGGMGVVVAAHHMQLDQRVALKFLLPEALSNAEAVARFAREARAAVKIKNEHVARVTDVGTLENGSPYIVMEYLEGGDLAGWIEKKGPLPIEQAAEFVIQTCVAVADAHALGIIHRDLKPANLFCIRRSDGQFSIKVLDFGISKTTGFAATGPSQGMTQTSSVLGSPLYMSPEQLRSTKSVDLRTDIWALGVVLFELVTGKPPFMSQSLPDSSCRLPTNRRSPSRVSARISPMGSRPSSSSAWRRIPPGGTATSASSRRRCSPLLPRVPDLPSTASSGSSSLRGSWEPSWCHRHRAGSTPKESGARSRPSREPRT